MKEIEQGFNDFWKVYPRRVSKKAAIKSFLKALKEGATVKEIVDGAKKYAYHIFNSDTESRFIKHPTTWLNQGCWEDEYELNAPAQESQNGYSYIQDLWRRAGNA